MPARPNFVFRSACVVAIVVTLACVFLHIFFAAHAGGLWRDEIGSVEISRMATFSELWSNLTFESFPALFPLLLRVFDTATDAQLRILGCVIGLLILGALWLNARWFRINFPLVSLALIGGNAMIIRYGDSMRGYGLGMLTILLSLGAFWRLAEKFTWPRVLFATLAALLSVQALYYNSVLLFAICMGAVAVLLRRKNFAQAAVILSIGGIAALSLVPYLPIVRKVREWDFVWKVPVTFANIWEKFSNTLGSPLHVLWWIWPTLLLLAILVGARELGRKRSDRMIFVCVTLAIGGLGYAKFLRVLGYQTQPWYFITLLAFTAFCLEIVFAKALALRATFALVFAAVAVIPAMKALRERQTNMDYVAAQLETSAAPEDLIVANPFPFGIPLHHYYRGRAVIATLPPLSDLRTHRADELKARMMSPEPIAPVVRKMGETLRAGHTVWLIGYVTFLSRDQMPLEVPPGKMIDGRWTGGDFYRAWAEQAGAFLNEHAEQFERVRVPLEQPVIHYENAPLSSFRGWREGGRERDWTR